MQHRVVLRFLPPSASKQAEITCAREKCVVFHNMVRPFPAALDVPTLATRPGCPVSSFDATKVSTFCAGMFIVVFEKFVVDGELVREESVSPPP